MIFKLDHDQLKGLSHEIESAVFDMHVQMNNWKNLQGLFFFYPPKNVNFQKLWYDITVVKLKLIDFSR